MIMRQLFLELTLFECDTKDYPIPTIPKVVYKSSKMFLNEDIEPSLAAMKYLARNIGLTEQILE